MKNQRALEICQRNYDSMLPDDYWDNPMDYDEEETEGINNGEE